MNAHSELQVAVDATLVLISRLAGGPVERNEDTAQWTAMRLEWPTGVPAAEIETVSIVCADGVRVTVYGKGTVGCLSALVKALNTPERYGAAKIRVATEECSASADVTAKNGAS